MIRSNAGMVSFAATLKTVATSGIGVRVLSDLGGGGVTFLPEKFTQFPNT